MASPPMQRSHTSTMRVAFASLPPSRESLPSHTPAPAASSAVSLPAPHSHSPLVHPPPPDRPPSSSEKTHRRRWSFVSSSNASASSWPFSFFSSHRPASPLPDTHPISQPAVVPEPSSVVQAPMPVQPSPVRVNSTAVAAIAADPSADAQLSTSLSSSSATLYSSASSIDAKSPSLERSATNSTAVASLVPVAADSALRQSGSLPLSLLAVYAGIEDLVLRHLSPVPADPPAPTASMRRRTYVASRKPSEPEDKSAASKPCTHAAYMNQEGRFTLFLSVVSKSELSLLVHTKELLPSDPSSPETQSLIDDAVTHITDLLKNTDLAKVIKVALELVAYHTPLDSPKRRKCLKKGVVRAPVALLAPVALVAPVATPQVPVPVPASAQAPAQVPAQVAVQAPAQAPALVPAQVAPAALPAVSNDDREAPAAHPAQASVLSSTLRRSSWRPSRSSPPNPAVNAALLRAALMETSPVYSRRQSSLWASQQNGESDSTTSSRGEDDDHGTSTDYETELSREPSFKVRGCKGSSDADDPAPSTVSEPEVSRSKGPRRFFVNVLLKR
ncbi:uncharacterized protein BJ171DRAFT_251167 [Polychytrium aggregatum]|uniref:uncharacterized protein n=1 Tax=Polychytrium aggregatum TaxID=110093 RepID=UPI0022FDCC93|nr:uncharacterized protein BJ171DRAFT_251167 [Polychytrium aggregatum]KAI9193559.1 hypothetical protein BJ171DRAFT_251167 [Polychytrium aggregatum]